VSSASPESGEFGPAPPLNFHFAVTADPAFDVQMSGMRFTAKWGTGQRKRTASAHLVNRLILCTSPDDTPGAAVA
jgi:hypothetical protein